MTSECHLGKLCHLCKFEGWTVGANCEVFLPVCAACDSQLCRNKCKSLAEVGSTRPTGQRLCYYAHHFYAHSSEEKIGAETDVYDTHHRSPTGAGPWTLRFFDICCEHSATGAVLSTSSRWLYTYCAASRSTEKAPFRVKEDIIQQFLSNLNPVWIHLSNPDPFKFSNWF